MAISGNQNHGIDPKCLSMLISVYDVVLMEIIDKCGLDHNMTLFKTKEQAALQLVLCKGILAMLQWVIIAQPNL